MENLDLEIGNPVFLMGKTDGTVYPGIVVSLTTTKTINGMTDVWTIMVGPKDNRRIITTESLVDFHVFRNIFELKEVLFKQIMVSIDNSVKEATSNLKKWYETEIPLPTLAKALIKVEKEKQQFKSAKNMSFADLAGKDAATAVFEKAAIELKKNKPKPNPKSKLKQKSRLKQVEKLSPVVYEDEIETKENSTEDKIPLESTETKIRVKMKGPNGEEIFVDSNDIDSMHDINF